MKKQQQNKTSAVLQHDVKTCVVEMMFFQVVFTSITLYCKC